MFRETRKRSRTMEYHQNFSLLFDENCVNWNDLPDITSLTRKQNVNAIFALVRWIVHWPHFIFVIVLHNWPHVCSVLTHSTNSFSAILTVSKNQKIKIHLVINVSHARGQVIWWLFDDYTKAKIKHFTVHTAERWWAESDGQWYDERYAPMCVCTFFK